MISISGNIVDLISKRIFGGTIEIENDRIINRFEEPEKSYDNYIIPGLIDSHIHIESSMLIPSEFSRLAVVHGTVATVSDPHEIANVLGLDGITFMIDNGKEVPFKFFFGAPSCVPATNFESSGAIISSKDIKILFEKYNLKYLSEMMNYPGVIYDFPDVIEKINIAKSFNLPIDGHAPGLNGKDLEKYIKSGITTDHECYSIDEAIEKINLGMKILIREGSAAKNFDTLIPLISDYSEYCMFCSDDKHPDDLIKGHINELVIRAVKRGYNLMDVLRAATLNPIKHFKLDVGLLQSGDYADCIVVNNLKEFKILKTFIQGKLVAENGSSLINSVKLKPINIFNAKTKIIDDFKVEPTKKKIRVIEVFDGQLITGQIIQTAKIENNNIISDIENDILKLTVINRYENTKPAIGFIKNFGLKRGALATSVAHDSHNIIAVGTSDTEITKAVNAIIENKGGIVVVDGKEITSLALPFAGLMSGEDGYQVSTKYSELNEKAKELGTNLKAPFMTLSFMALLVIPNLKLSDKGLFDSSKFEFVDLQTD